MKLYNSKTQIVEDLQVIDGEISVYVCGITPYDTTHLGHAFTYTAYDHLIRYLEQKGTRVRYAQNVTDIDDDILKKAKETGADWRELGNQWTEHFINDMIALNVRPPDFFPHATEVMAGIIKSVEDLIHAGVAYVNGGSVYYEVSRYTDFGQLSHLPRHEMLPIANERGNHPDDPKKRDPLDFVLWQAQAPGEPRWDSPWGPGRPGWHIECSTMSREYLGKTIDIHGGGLDLCFPHHECEIAQVKPIQKDDPYVRIWMHTAMVGFQGEKMSKSLGNLVMVSDLLKTYKPNALRMYLGSHHYRAAWSYDEKEMQEYQRLADRLDQAAALQSDVESRSNKASSINTEDYEHRFNAAMENDLDTPGALHVLQALTEEILESGKDRHSIQAAKGLLRKSGRIFGLILAADTPEEQVRNVWEAHKR